MKKLDHSSFASDVEKFNGVSVVDFYADWCPPCKILLPTMEELSKQNSDKSVTYAKLNVDDNQEIAGSFGIMSIPTVIIFKNGKPVQTFVGVQDKSVYTKAVEDAKKA